ncbi:MAG: roadblock/LC7 domain-containing protein [Candidatus Obscuribacterales bacterium]|nr:roadblock/LC7 domain-containing protein [Candidatus Obscuribacterales bacterium]
MRDNLQLTDEAKSELTQLLRHITQQKEVVGCLLIGHDGLLIANLLPPSFDAESIGLFVLGIYMNTSTTATKMGHEHITQIVAKTSRGYVVIGDFGGGLLIIISDDSGTVPFVPLPPGLGGSPVLT